MTDDASTDSGEPILILIADDNNADRMLLEVLVRKQGHRVITAGDGVEAVAAFQEHDPDLILLDVMMPNKDGYEAAAEIKELAGEKLVPIIFLTSLQEPEALAKCLDVGGDDFLSKPYKPVVLRAKIRAFDRMRRLHAMMQDQRDEISLHNMHMTEEQTAARVIFDNVAHPGCMQAKNLKRMLSPMSIFNGDIALAARTPGGDMHVLLGDFTGHGLPAAIGAMPLSEVFYQMSAEGFGITDILPAINQKLKSILPASYFCCAAMASLSFVSNRMEIWVGGLPDVYLYHPQYGRVDRIKSRHLPLGVLGASGFKCDTEIHDMEFGSRLYLWSDGIVEAENTDGEMFGDDRLYEVFEANEEPEALFDEIRGRVADYIEGEDWGDDTTMLEVQMMPAEEMTDTEVTYQAGELLNALEWKFSYELPADTAKNFNPVSLLLRILSEVPSLRPHQVSLHTVLTEMYSNALEHGVMGLDSSLKKSPDGFAEYYSERARLLNESIDGFVCFDIVCKMGDGVEQHRLQIRVRDSGAGFDWQTRLADRSMDNSSGVDVSKQFHGRGIFLLRQLCESVEYLGAGNEAQAVYRW